MLLCRVALGDPCVMTSQNPSLRLPPLKNNFQRYHSVIGGTYHKEFVVYHSFQCYPEYVLFV